MDKAALQVQSGAFSYDEAIRLATRDLADHMDYVQYPSGHRDTLEVASRRAVRTGVNQMSSKLTLQRCKELGIDFVETTAHAGARVSKSLDCRNHSWWQGKVFHLSKEGAKGEDGKFYPGFYSFEHAGYGYGEGICGWNCRHSFHPFMPGISEQVYTPEQLDKLNEKKFTYEGKQYSRYEADQYQRKLERNIRKYKRRAVLSEGVGDQKETERNQSYIRKWSNELDKFTRATGLKRDYERERETVGQVVDESPQNDANTVESVAESRKNVAKDDIIVAGSQQSVIARVKDNSVDPSDEKSSVLADFSRISKKQIKQIERAQSITDFNEVFKKSLNHGKHQLFSSEFANLPIEQQREIAMGMLYMEKTLGVDLSKVQFTSELIDELGLFIAHPDGTGLIIINRDIDVFESFITSIHELAHLADHLSKDRYSSLVFEIFEDLEYSQAKIDSVFSELMPYNNEELLKLSEERKKKEAVAYAIQKYVVNDVDLN